MIKVTAADRAFSLCVRERADWTCERCGREYRHDPARLHCSHVFSRRWGSIRHEPTNAMALDYGCHRHVSENPPDHIDLYIQIFGEEALDELKRMKEVIVRKKDRPDKAISQWMTGEHRRMLRLRSLGETGRLEFDRFEPIQR